MMQNNTRILAKILFSRLWAKILILLCSVIAASFGLLVPFFQKRFIDYFTQGHHRPLFPIESEYFLGISNSPAILISLAFIFMVLSQFLNQLTNYLGMRESVKLQKQISSLIYNKTLSLKVDTLSQRSIGEIVSLYATDVPGSTMLLEQTLPMGASTLFPLILAPIATAYLFNTSVFSTILIMVLVSTINTTLAFRQSKYFYMFKHLAAQRLGLVNEWVQNIRTLRILGWTEVFESRIKEKRIAETDNRVTMVTNGQIMNSISSSVTFILNVVTLGSFVFLSNKALSPGEILALLWILGVFLVRPFRQMPWFFTFAFDAITSIKRLENFLALKNISTQLEPQQNLEQQVTSTNKISNEENPLAIDIKNLQLEIKGRIILDHISFQVKPGEFVAVVGEVGSGKTLLLLSLLKETGAAFEKYNIFGQNVLNLSDQEIRNKYSFVPQESFIMNATLRENVSFLYDFPVENDMSIDESLKVAQFNITGERLEKGLSTEIGERGVNLSGGQKQRVSLARVHFSSADIILLDDCFSALDVDTEKHLINDLINGSWKNKTKVLSTHRLSVLRFVDRVIFLNEGKIIAQGTYEELLKTNKQFQEYTKTIQKENMVKEQGLL